ncbi:hypothetical protein K438DRAFT_191989 [Mycena galopus ATCC 62051]|nr:hypothetical protein K438DRAFT_191989 [Mycena galopus ATCC 62051]
MPPSSSTTCSDLCSPSSHSFHVYPPCLDCFWFIPLYFAYQRLPLRPSSSPSPCSSHRPFLLARSTHHPSLRHPGVYDRHLWHLPSTIPLPSVILVSIIATFGTYHPLSLSHRCYSSLIVSPLTRFDPLANFGRPADFLFRSPHFLFWPSSANQLFKLETTAGFLLSQYDLFLLSAPPSPTLPENGFPLKFKFPLVLSFLNRYHQSFALQARIFCRRYSFYCPTASPSLLFSPRIIHTDDATLNTILLEGISTLLSNGISL